MSFTPNPNDKIVSKVKPSNLGFTSNPNDKVIKTTTFVNTVAPKAPVTPLTTTPATPVSAPPKIVSPTVKTPSTPSNNEGFWDALTNIVATSPLNSWLTPSTILYKGAKMIFEETKKPSKSLVDTDTRINLNKISEEPYHSPFSPNMTLPEKTEEQKLDAATKFFTPAFDKNPSIEIATNKLFFPTKVNVTENKAALEEEGAAKAYNFIAATGTTYETDPEYGIPIRNSVPMDDVTLKKIKKDAYDFKQQKIVDFDNGLNVKMEKELRELSLKNKYDIAYGGTAAMGIGSSSVGVGGQSLEELAILDKYKKLKLENLKTIEGQYKAFVTDYVAPPQYDNALLAKDILGIALPLKEKTVENIDANNKLAVANIDNTINIFNNDKNIYNTLVENGNKSQNIYDPNTEEVVSAAINSGQQAADIYNNNLNTVKPLQKITLDGLAYQGLVDQIGVINQTIKSTTAALAEFNSEDVSDLTPEGLKAHDIIGNGIKANLIKLQELKGTMVDWGVKNLAAYSEYQVRQDKVTEFGLKDQTAAVTGSLMEHFGNLPKDIYQITGKVGMTTGEGNKKFYTQPLTTGQKDKSTVPANLVIENLMNQKAYSDIRPQIKQDGVFVNIDKAEAIQLFDKETGKFVGFENMITPTAFFYQAGKTGLESTILGGVGGAIESGVANVGETLIGQTLKNQAASYAAKGGLYRVGDAVISTAITTAKIGNRITSMVLPTGVLYTNQMYTDFRNQGFDPEQSKNLTMLSVFFEGGFEAAFGNDIKLYNALLGKTESTILKKEAAVIFDKAIGAKILEATGRPATIAELSLAKRLVIGTKSWLKNTAAPFAKQGIAVGLEESAEEEGTGIATALIIEPKQKEYNPSYVEKGFSAEDALTTMVTTMATMLPMMGTAGYHHIQHGRVEALQAKFEVGSAPLIHLQNLKNSFDLKQISKEDYEKAVVYVEQYASLKKGIDGAVENAPNLRSFTNTEKENIKLQIFSEQLKKSDIEKQIMVSLTNKQKAALAEQLSAIDDHIANLIENGTYTDIKQRNAAQLFQLDYLFNDKTIPLYNDPIKVGDVMNELEAQQAREIEPKIIAAYDQKINALADRFEEILKERHDAYKKEKGIVDEEVATEEVPQEDITAEEIITPETEEEVAPIVATEEATIEAPLEVMPHEQISNDLDNATLENIEDFEKQIDDLVDPSLTPEELSKKKGELYNKLWDKQSDLSSPETTKERAATPTEEAPEQTPQDLIPSTREAKTDMPIGKVGNTEYEVKADGIEYKGKKLDNPKNLPHKQLITEDIERRKEEELGKITSSHQFDKERIAITSPDFIEKLLYDVRGNTFFVTKIQKSDTNQYNKGFNLWISINGGKEQIVNTAGITDKIISNALKEGFYLFSPKEEIDAKYKEELDALEVKPTTDTKTDIEKEKSTITDSEFTELKKLAKFFLENPKKPTTSGSVVTRYPALFKAITDIEKERKEEIKQKAPYVLTKDYFEGDNNTIATLSFKSNIDNTNAYTQQQVSISDNALINDDRLSKITKEQYEAAIKAPKLIKEINVIYDAKIAALKEQPTSNQSEIEAKKADIERRRKEELTPFEVSYIENKIKKLDPNDRQTLESLWNLYTYGKYSGNVQIGGIGEIEKKGLITHQKIVEAVYNVFGESFGDKFTEFLESEEDGKTGRHEISNIKEINAKYDAELAALEKPETKTVDQQIVDLRAQEQAEYESMTDPNDEEAKKEIYDRYDKLITPLLKSQEENKAGQTSTVNVEIPKLMTVRVDLSSLNIDELKNVAKQLRQKAVDARQAEKEGKTVLGGSESIENDYQAIKKYIEELSASGAKTTQTTTVDIEKEISTKKEELEKLEKEKQEKLNPLIEEKERIEKEIEELEKEEKDTFENRPQKDLEIKTIQETARMGETVHIMQDARGAKALKGSIRRLFESFEKAGYTVVMPYDSLDNYEVVGDIFNLKEGNINIVSPVIFYKGKLVQKGKIIIKDELASKKENEDKKTELTAQEIKIQKQLKEKIKDIELDKEYSINEVETILNKLGLNKQSKFIFNLIKNVAKQLGVTISFSDGHNIDNANNGTYSLKGHEIIINLYGIIASPTTKNSDNISRVIAHEIVHGVTRYLTFVYGVTKGGTENSELLNIDKNILTNVQKNSIENLLKLLTLLKNDSNFEGQYGLTNIDELLAELTNEEFVSKLKNKKFGSTNKSFFDKVLDYLSKLLGIEVKDNNYYEKVLLSLQGLLLDPNIQVLKKVTSNIKSKSEFKRLSLEEALKERTKNEIFFNEITNQLNDIKIIALNLGIDLNNISASKRETTKLQELKQKLEELNKKIDEVAKTFDTQIIKKQIELKALNSPFREVISQDRLEEIKDNRVEIEKSNELPEVDETPTPKEEQGKEVENLKNKGLTFKLGKGFTAVWDSKQGKFIYFKRVKKQDVEIDNFKQIVRLANLTSKIPGIAKTWYKDLLNSKQRQGVNELILEYRNALQTLQGVEDYKTGEDFDTIESYLMRAIQGGKFKSIQLEGDVTDVNRKYWFSAKGKDLDEYITHDLMNPDIKHGLIQSGFSDYSARDVQSIITDLIMRYPRGITDADIEQNNPSPFHTLRYITDDFIYEYGISLEDIFYDTDIEELKQLNLDEEIQNNLPGQQETTSDISEAEQIISEAEQVEQVEKLEAKATEVVNNNNEIEQKRIIIGEKNYNPLGSVMPYGKIDQNHFIYLRTQRALFKLRELQAKDPIEFAKKYFATVQKNTDKLLDQNSINANLAPEKITNGVIVLITDEKGVPYLFDNDGNISNDGSPIFQNFNSSKLISEDNLKYQTDVLLTGESLGAQYDSNSLKVKTVREILDNDPTKKITFTIDEITPTENGQKSSEKLIFSTNDLVSGQSQTLSQSTKTTQDKVKSISVQMYTVNVKNSFGVPVEYSARMPKISTISLKQTLQDLLDLTKTEGLPEELQSFSARRELLRSFMFVTLDSEYNKFLQGTKSAPLRYFAVSNNEVRVILRNQNLSLEEWYKSNDYKYLELNENRQFLGNFDFKMYNWDTQTNKFVATKEQSYKDFILSNITFEGKNITQKVSTIKLDRDVSFKPKEQATEQVKPIIPQESPLTEKPKDEGKKDFDALGDGLDDFTNVPLNRLKILPSRKISEKQESKAIEWFNKYQSKTGVSLKPMLDAVNDVAYAQWYRGAITLFKGSTSADLYHEAFHDFTQLYLTKKQKIALYNEVAKIKEGQKILNTLKKDATDLEKYHALEELMAEDFKNYMLSDQKLILGERPKRNSIFRKIFNFLKELFTNQPSLETIYKNLANNNIKGQRDFSNAMFGTLNSDIKGLDEEQTQDVYRVIDSVIGDKFRKTGLSIAGFFKDENKLRAAYNSVHDSILKTYKELENTPENALSITNSEFLLANWNNVRLSHVQNSPLLRLSKEYFKINEDEFDEEKPEVKGSMYDDDSSRSVREKASAQLIYLIATQPAYLQVGDKQIPKPNAFLPYIQDVEDFNSLWNNVANILNGTLTYEQQYKKLQKEAETNLTFKDLVSSLPNPFQKLDGLTAQLRNQFIIMFSQPLIPMKIMNFRFQADGSLNVTANNATVSSINKIKEDWKYNLQSSKNPYATVNYLGRNELDIDKVLEDFVNIGIRPEETKIAFLNALGISFSPKTLRSEDFKTFLSDKYKLKRLYDSLKEIQTSKNDDTLDFRAREKASQPFYDATISFSSQGDQATLKELADIEVKNGDKYIGDNMLNANGDSTYGIRQYSQQSMMFAYLNDYELYPTYNDLINSPIGAVFDITKNPDADNIFLKALFNLKEGNNFGERYIDKKTNKPVQITLYNHNGLSITSFDELPEPGETTLSLSRFLKAVQDISPLLESGEKENLRYGDKVTANGTLITFKREGILPALNPHIPVDIKDFKNSYLPEQAYSIFKNRLFTTLKRTNDFFVNGTLQDATAFSTNVNKGDYFGILDGMLSEETKKILSQDIKDKELDISKLLKDNETIIRKDIADYMKELVEDYSKELSKNKLIDPSKFVSTFLLDTHGFDTILKAYIANSYILNMEHISLFFQDIRFYTDKNNYKEPFKRFSKACLGYGTKIIMYDGSLKEVQDIVVGDKLMGVDSTPREVLELHSGVDDMYEVSQKRGISYVVNSEHLISLKTRYRKERKRIGTGNKRAYIDEYYEKPKDVIINIPAKELINKSKRFFSDNLGWKAKEINFNTFGYTSKDLPIDPYYMGLWLGDGSSDIPNRIFNIDKEVINYISDYAEKLGLQVTKNRIAYDITCGVKSNRWLKGNTIINEFNRLGLKNNKYIHNLYLYNTRENRLKLLAGLLDSDGYLRPNSSGFVICQVRKELLKQIIFLAQSLGFIVSYSELDGSKYNKNNKIRYTTNISGINLNDIPTKIERKKAKPSKCNNDFSVTEVSIKPIGIGNYYGFELSGDRLFLLEDFTVTHNTSTGIRLVNDPQINAFLQGTDEELKHYNAINGTNILERDKSLPKLSAIFNDIGYSENSPELKDLLDMLDKVFKNSSKEDLLNIRKAHIDMKPTDAMAFCTFDFYREVAIKSGNDEWSPEKNSLYKKIATEQKLTEEETKSAFLFFPPLKLRVVGFTQDKEGNVIPLDYKFAISPLLGSIVKGKGYEVIKDNMLRQQVSLGLFNSASKHSSIGVMKDNKLQQNALYNEDNTPNSGDWVLNPIQQDFIFEVVPSPKNYKEEATFSTQLRKLLFVNSFDNGIPIDYKGTKFFKTLTEAEKIKQSYVYYLDNTIANAIDDLVTLEKNTILNKIGATLNTKTDKYTFDDAKLSAFLEEELSKRNISKNALDTLKVIDGKFKYSLDSSLQRESLEQILLSIIDNKLKKQKSIGESLIQASSIGYEDFNKAIKIKPEVKELFDSNPELANQVYEALGFVKNLNKLKVQDTKTKVSEKFSNLKDTRKELKEEITSDKSLSELEKNLLIKAVDGIFDIPGSNPFITDDIKGYASYNIKKFEEFIKYEFPNLDKKQITAILSKHVEHFAVQHKAALLSELEGESDLPNNMADLELSKITPQQKQQALQQYSQYLDTKQADVILPTDKIIWGHPAIGKSYAAKKVKMIDFDSYKLGINRKYNLYIAPGLSDTELRTDDKTREARENWRYESEENQALWNQFIRDSWQQAKKDAKKQGAILFASDLLVLREFGNEVDKALTMPDELFFERSKQRNNFIEGELGTKVWKENLNKAVENFKEKFGDEKVINTEKYLSDLFLGSKQDIEGFKKFVSKPSSKKVMVSSWKNVGGWDLPYYGYEGRTLPDGTKVTSAHKVKIALQGDFKKLLDLKDVKDLANNPDVIKEAKAKGEGYLPEMVALNRLLKDEKWLDKDNNRRLVSIIGVRIPVQGHNSKEFMEVFEFLPTEAGPIVIVSPALVAKSGGDFDWDKVTSSFPSFEVNKEGKAFIYKKVEGLDNPKNNINNKKALNNIINDAMRKVLERTENIQQLLIPNSTHLLEPLADARKAALNNKKASWSDVASPQESLNQHESNSVGKQSLGILAVANTFFSQLQRAGAYMSKIFRKDLNNPKTRKINHRLSHNKTDNGNISLSSIMDALGLNRISDVFSQLINGAVDVAKKDWIFFINGIKEIIPNIAYLNMTGTPVLENIAFHTQPIINDFIETLKNYKSPLVKYTNRKAYNLAKIHAIYETIAKYADIPQTSTKLVPGQKIISKTDIDRFIEYVNKSNSKPKEFFTSDSKFTEFYQNDLGIQRGIPQSSKWFLNDKGYYDLIDQETGEFLIDNVSLATGIQYNEPAEINQPVSSTSALSHYIRDFKEIYEKVLKDPTMAPLFYGYMNNQMTALADKFMGYFEYEKFKDFAIPVDGKLKVPTTQEEKFAQVLYLVQFLEFESQQSTLSSVRTTMNQDTKKPINLQDSNERLLKQKEAQNHEILPKEVIKKLVTESTTKAFTSPTQGVDAFISKLLDKIFDVTDHPIFNQFLKDEFAKPHTYNPVKQDRQTKQFYLQKGYSNMPFNVRYDLKEAWIKAVKNDFIEYLAKNNLYLPNDPSTRVSDYFFTNLINYNIGLHVTLDTIKDKFPELLNNNLLLQYLEKDPSKIKVNGVPQYMNLKLKTERIEPVVEKVLIEAFKKLINFSDSNYSVDDQVLIRTFAQDLAYLAFNQSGLNSSKISFTKIIPQELYSEDLTNIIRSFKKLMDENPETAIKEFDTFYKLFKKNNSKFFRANDISELYPQQPENAPPILDINFAKETNRGKNYVTPEAIDLLSKREQALKLIQEKQTQHIKDITAQQVFTSDIAKDNPRNLYVYNSNTDNNNKYQNMSIKVDNNTDYPNTIHIPTYKSFDGNYTDADFSKIKVEIDAQIQNILSYIKQNNPTKVIFPQDILDRLNNAPKIKEYLQQQLNHYFDLSEKTPIFTGNTQVMNNIYDKLSKTTITPNIVISNIKTKDGKYDRDTNIAEAKANNRVYTMEVVSDVNSFSNPWAHFNRTGTIKTNTTKEAVQNYIDWLTTDKFKDVKPKRREFILDVLKSGKLKGRELQYYAELKEPSHATALDYLINQYDWSKPTTQISNNIEPKGQKIAEGIYVNQEGLNPSEELELFNLIKPVLEQQAIKTNKGESAPKMAGLNLNWDYVSNRRGKQTRINVGRALKPNDTYGWFTSSSNGQKLYPITGRMVELMSKATGIDVTNYDGSIINIYNKNSFIGNHPDIDESVTAEKYPVVVVNIGGPGNIVLGTDKQAIPPVQLKSGAGYVFGFNGKNRTIPHSTYASPIKGTLPAITTQMDGETLEEGSYRVSITVRRVMPLEPGMPKTPAIVSTQPTISVKNFSKKNLFTVTPQQGVSDNKAKAKASIATQYIGFGEGIIGRDGKRSTTQIYREQVGALANTGNYSANDVIFVSIPGLRGDAEIAKREQNKTIKEAIKALEAGATIITDNKDYIDSSAYNTGEQRLYKNMEAKGYSYSEITVDGQVLGIWENNNKPSIEEEDISQEQPESTNIFDEEVVPNNQLDLFSTQFDALKDFTKERKEEIVNNFKNKHKMSTEEALRDINKGLELDKEAMIQNLKDCY